MEKVKLATHNGSFHADDIFACATLLIYLDKQKKDYEVVRTRDFDILKEADFVFDVGGIYDPKINRFDHHQKGGAGKRKNGIPYASFGLVWKHVGLEVCGGDEDVWNLIDKKIASPVDAVDNGLDLVRPIYDGIFPYSADGIFMIYSPTWKENNLNIDDIFLDQARKAKYILLRQIQVAMDDVEGRRIMIDSYNKSKDKRIVELDVSFPRYLLQGTLSELPEPIYVVYPSAFGKNWKVEAVAKSRNSYESRKPFPENWRGFLNNDPKLGEITGVPEANFSHNSGFLMNTSSRESAILLAQKALEITENKSFFKKLWRS